MGKKSVVLLSGGIDSATCLAKACIESEAVFPIHFNYGQRTEHSEAKLSKDIAEWAREEFDCKVSGLINIEYSPIFKHFIGGLTDREQSLTGQEHDDDYNPAYVPIRNLHFLSFGASKAYDIDAGEVWFGAQSGEAGMNINPDVRHEFIFSAQVAINQSLSPDDQIKIRAPFVGRPKHEVIEVGDELGVPWEKTWSCYNSPSENRVACGECDACYERTEAFKKAGLQDSLEYEL